MNYGGQGQHRYYADYNPSVGLQQHYLNDQYGNNGYNNPNAYNNGGSTYHVSSSRNNNNMGGGPVNNGGYFPPPASNSMLFNSNDSLNQRNYRTVNTHNVNNGNMGNGGMAGNNYNNMQNSNGNNYNNMQNNNGNNYNNMQNDNGNNYNSMLNNIGNNNINNISPEMSDMFSATAPQPERDYPVVMAIDIGTTFTRVSYALKADGELCDIIKWPRLLVQDQRTPTLSLYKKGSSEILDWGHSARLAMLRPSAKDFCLLRRFKLQLDETVQQAPLENGISALEAVTHYLKKIHGHAMYELKKGSLKNYEPSQFQYVLTVPARWSDTAKNKMRRAAIDAGLIEEGDPANRLILILEPDAAAMYCLQMVDRFPLVHGDRFMICDAGRETVDSIVFEVSESTHQSRGLREITRGHGGSCGSNFLDTNMERLLEHKFQRYRRGIKARAWASLMDTFDSMIKPIFNGQDDVLMQIPQSTGLEDLNDPEIGIEEGVLCVSAEEMKNEVYEPVISDVLDLIRVQLHQSKNCNAIFLVGGFGSSRYLEERVRQEFSHLVSFVAVPQRPDLAIVRGAVCAGLNAKVNVRVARRWYGINAATEFEEGVDPESKKIISSDGRVRCKERFLVYVRPGQQTGVDECVSKKYVTLSYPKDLDFPLYVCDSPTQPRYITDSGMKKIADLHIPMPEIPGAQPGTHVVFRLNLYFGKSPTLV
ncbi:hypothetical protein BGZ81_000354 [Podila clonocystis]|nr:hypothetical protein BGZ81_000354 [Podila clonocystis]